MWCDVRPRIPYTPASCDDTKITRTAKHSGKFLVTSTSHRKVQRQRNQNVFIKLQFSTGSTFYAIVGDYYLIDIENFMNEFFCLSHHPLKLEIVTDSNLCRPWIWRDLKLTYAFNFLIIIFISSPYILCIRHCINKSCNLSARGFQLFFKCEPVQNTVDEWNEICKSSLLNSSGDSESAADIRCGIRQQQHNRTMYKTKISWEWKVLSQ